MITIFCDSLNYLETLNDVKMTFERVYQHLNKNGVFIFDVHTVHKMKTLFNNKSYIDESDNVFVGWDAICGDEPLSVYHEMTFFVSQQNGLYQRFDESHYQRTYEEQIYRNLLKDVGYHSVKTFTDFNIHSHEEDAHRLFLLLKINFKSKITSQYVNNTEGVIFVFNINRRYIDFYEMEVVHLDYINNVNNILFYLLNDNNNDLIQNSQERQSKISDQQIKNSKS